MSAAPSARRADARATVARLREAGHVAYFAGGCVRDLLLGIDPKDYDVATDAVPARVRELFPRSQSVGAAFGVILVRQPSSSIEVATFRCDGPYTDGRHPNAVQFTTAEQDAQRRDFTINGLFLDPLDQDQVIDFVGGQSDLKARLIRAIGDPYDRFAEDHLRILRAIRFAARLGFEIEESTFAAMRQQAAHLIRISPERIADELRRMLVAPTRLAARSFLRGAIEDLIFRFAEPAKLAIRPAGQVETHLSPSDAISFPLALAGIIVDRVWSQSESIKGCFGPSTITRTVKALRQSLRLSNEETDSLLEILSIESLLQPDRPTIATMKRFLAKPTSKESRQLLAAMQQAGAISSERFSWLDSEFRRFPIDQITPAPLLTGDDLTAAGFKPGPAFKRVLDQVYNAQLEGDVTDPKQAMELARKRFAKEP